MQNSTSAFGSAAEETKDITNVAPPKKSGFMSGLKSGLGSVGSGITKVGSGIGSGVTKVGSGVTKVGSGLSKGA